MKSNLFSIQDLPDSEEFNKDIKILCGLDTSVIEQLPAIALEMIETHTEAEAENVREYAAEKLSVPLSRLGHALTVLVHLLRQFAPNGDAENDDASAVLDDLMELCSVPPQKRAELLKFLEETKRLAQEKVYMVFLKKAYVQSTLPVLSSVSTVIDFRAIFDEAYRYEEDIEQYKPRFMGTVPIGIIELRLSGAQSKEIFFQVSKRTLQVLIDSLTALQKQIAIAEKEIKS